MRSLCQSVLLMICTLAGSLSAAEEPILTVDVSDFERTRQRFADSVYQVIWSHDLLADVRKQMAKQTMRDAKNGRPSFLPILQSLASAKLQFNGMKEKQKPKLLAQFDVGAYADLIWAYLGKQDGEAVPAPQGADAAMLREEGRERAARFGNNIVISSLCDPIKQELNKSESDMSAEMSIVKLMEMISALGEMPQADFAMIEDALPGDRAHWSTRLTANSIQESFTLELTSQRIPGFVDASVFDSLPANTLLVTAFHVNGKFTEAEMRRQNLNNDLVVAEINQVLNQLGTNYQDLFADINGSFLIAVTPGIPFPAVTLMLPRSQQVDQAIEQALGLAEIPVPATGSAQALPIPGLPVLVQVGRNKGYWIVSSDAVALPKILQEADGGFKQGVLAPIIKREVNESSNGILAYDTKTLLQMGMQYAMFIPDVNVRANVNDLLGKLRQVAEVSYMSLYWGDQTLEYRAEGLLGGYLTSMPVLAAIAVPNLMGSRMRANESAAAASMKSAIFTGQIMFQAGAYHDANQNGVGRFGFIEELAGNRAVLGANKGDLQIITGALANAESSPAQAANYYFKVYLPNGKDGAYASPDEIPKGAAGETDLMERHFIVYAWPKDPDMGEKMFAIREDGMLLVPDEEYHGQYDSETLPPWNLIYGEDGEWGDALDGWSMYIR